MMRYNPREVVMLVDTILTDAAGKISKLLGIAGTCFKDMDNVVKAAMHYRALGDERKTDSIRPLILELEELEVRKPEVKGVPPVSSRLVGALSFAPGMPAGKLEMYKCRAHASGCLIQEVGGKRAIKVVGPLISAMRNPDCADICGKLLRNLQLGPLGKSDIQDMKSLTYNATSALSYPDRAPLGELFLEKLIKEGNYDLVYLAAPLLAATKDRKCQEPVRRLMEVLEEKPLGRGDRTALDSLGDVFLKVRAGGNDAERQYAGRIMRKLESEGMSVDLGRRPVLSPRITDSRHQTNPAKPPLLRLVR
jgi:hypothetical protein